MMILAGILFILWLLGIFGVFVIGWFIHVFLVIAIILFFAGMSKKKTPMVK